MPKLSVAYKSPAFYDDLLTIRTKIGAIRSRSIRFIYEVYRSSDESVLAEGETLHLVTDKNKKIRSLPDTYKLLLRERPGEVSFSPDKAKGD